MQVIYRGYDSDTGKNDCSCRLYGGPYIEEWSELIIFIQKGIKLFNKGMKVLHKVMAVSTSEWKPVPVFG